MRNRLLVMLSCVVALAVQPAGLAGQSETGDHTAPSLLLDSLDSDSTLGSRPASQIAVMPQAPREFRWYHALAVLGAIAVVSPLDEPIRNTMQDHRSKGGDDASKFFRRMGQPEIYATVALGTVAAGLISGNDRVARAGGRITGGLLLAGALNSALKVAVGRRRPLFGEEQYSFRPLSSANSWPSGHSAMAFALATSVSDEVHSTPVTIGLYTMASLTGWSRMNDNKHWLSDVLGGAVTGVVSAKLMNGHWRVFGVGAPHFLLQPGAVGVNLQF